MNLYLALFIFFNFSFALAGGAILPPSNTTKAKEVVRDIIEVHGMRLKGRITNIGSQKLSFRLIHCDGVNHIYYEDIDSIVTKYKYQISYNRKKIVGRVIGIVNKEFLKVQLSKEILLVKIADIDNFVMSVQDNDTVENRIRNKFPYTSGDMSLGLEFEEGTNNKVKTDIMMNWWHKKAGNEMHLYVDYSKETTSTEDTPRVQNKDELTSIFTDRYYYQEDNFIFASLMGEFDRPRHIQSRYVPAFGYGYKFKLDKNNFLQPAIGLAYISTVYTDNELYPDNTFTGAILALNAKYSFDDVVIINRLIVDGTIIYYPSLANPKEDWIWRSSVNFTIPLFDFISMKLAIQWINDSNPNPNVGNNKTTTNLLFGIDF